MEHESLVPNRIKVNPPVGKSLYTKQLTLSGDGKVSSGMQAGGQADRHVAKWAYVQTGSQAGKRVRRRKGRWACIKQLTLWMFAPTLTLQHGSSHRGRLIQ